MRSWLRNLHRLKLLPPCWQLLSAWYSAPSGVPQGSILSPLLFVVHVNELPGQLCGPSLMYADDIKIRRTIKNPNARSSLQADLNNLAQGVDT
ncbi:unnamed protein product [Echinostoma caproni]|uniref:Reverse transcriptase domain-containing protein n=1 Tax=Echinostoma caproni TaxID=27848 RepID=A0A183BG61_9TREM|nr:unnamed protein product [Echinostoma caproni]